MTTDFTSTIASSKKTSAASDKLSSAFKAEFKTADKSVAFDSLLSTASKSYVDKGSSNTSSFNSKDYATNTKATKESVSSRVDNTKTPNAFAEVKDKVNDKKTQNTKSEKTDNHIDEKNQIKKQNTEVKNTDDDNKVQNEQQPQDVENQLKDLTQNTQAQQTAMQEAAKQPVKNTADNENAVESESPENDEASTEAVNKTKEAAIDSKNTLANEKIIANIEYVGESIQEPSQDTVESADTLPVQDVEVSENNTPENEVSQKNGEKMNEIDAKIVEKVLQNFKTSNGESGQSPIQNYSTAIPQAQAENAVPAQGKVPQAEVSDTVSNSDIDVNVENAQSQKVNTDTNTTPKTAKENLAADTSRLTVNIENAVKDAADDTAVLTPVSKTETTTVPNQTAEPVIKVTDEVASQAKSNVEVPVNKDFTASAKDKAAAQMTDMQGTNTVVTEVQNTSRNQSQSNTNQNNGSMTKGNAAEQAVKLSVDNASGNSNLTGAESFMNKLDAKLGSFAKTTPQNTLLNKSDIMSQMNAKFNEMQLGGQNKVSIILQPENLGKVSVEIMNSKDGIVAKMTTDNQQVKELFDKNMEALKSSLGSQGVNVNNIKVECTSESSNNAMNFERDQFNQSNFSDSNGQNKQAHNSEQNAQTIYSNEYGTSDEAVDELNNMPEIKNTDSIIKHNGKVDYTV